VREIDQSWYSGSPELLHYVITGPGNITPFGVGTFKSTFSIPVRYDYNRRLGDYTWKAAVYILARNSDPVWYQVSFKINHELLSLVIPSKKAIPDSLRSVERVTGVRPVVAWEREHETQVLL
jgi:hypothetical protein